MALLTDGGVGCWKRRGRRWKVEWEKGGVEIVEAMGIVVESSRAESLWGREVVCGRVRWKVEASYSGVEMRCCKVLGETEPLLRHCVM